MATILVDRSEDQDSVYDKFIYDIIVPEGVVYVGSAYSIDETISSIILFIYFRNRG